MKIKFRSFVPLIDEPVDIANTQRGEPRKSLKMELEAV